MLNQDPGVVQGEKILNGGFKFSSSFKRIKTFKITTFPAFMCIGRTDIYEVILLIETIEIQNENAFTGPFK